MSCSQGDQVCVVRVYEQEVIVVPTLLLGAFLVTLVFILLLHFCPERVERLRPRKKHTTRRILQGIDAPPGINVLEHESIALDMPSSYSTFQPPAAYITKNLSSSMRMPTLPASPPPEPTKHAYSAIQPRELPRQRLPESFKLVTPLAGSFSLRSDSCVSLYRASMENRNVVLRVLKDSADATERDKFLEFASFLSQIGTHPFLPELLGVVSIRAPLVIVVEELENRDLLSFLWRCRQAKMDPQCEMTERRIFTMASQVASALEFLHGKDILHGNIRAHSVLITRALTAKLWGLHGVYTRKNKTATQKDDPSMKKWQAPELLVRKPATPSSDIWSFGILLFEMITLGDAPFADVTINELLQFHQRGKSLKKPSNCPNTLYALIKSCCQWKEQERPSLPEVGRKLASGEKGASDRPLQAPGPVNMEQYVQEAGFGETNSYTVF